MIKRLNQKYLICYLMIAPFLLFFFVFIVLPILSSFFLSFTYYNIMQAPRFNGLDNYIRLFTSDDLFILSMRNTLIIALITGPVSYFACLIFAWLINELKPFSRSIFTLLLYAPSMSGSVFLVWAFIFSSDQYGLINSFLLRLGLADRPVQWLLDPKHILTVIIIVQIWLSLGTSFLSFIGGLQTINTDLYEAGAIDGIRNRWQELFLITLPSMGPQLLFGAVIQISASFSVHAICVALAGYPSTDDAARTVLTHIYDFNTTRLEVGYASAISFVFFAMLIVINYAIKSLIKRYASE